MNRVRRAVIVTFLERVVNHPRPGMDLRGKISPLRKDKMPEFQETNRIKPMTLLSAKRIEFNHAPANPAIARRLQSTRLVGRVAELGSLGQRFSMRTINHQMNDEGGFISSSGFEFMVMGATVAVYLGLVLPLAARLRERPSLAIATAVTPVALIYVGALAAALFGRSRGSERLSSRAVYCGNVAFVLITFGCAVVWLFSSLCNRMFQWLFTT